MFSAVFHWFRHLFGICFFGKVKRWPFFQSGNGFFIILDFSWGFMLGFFPLVIANTCF